MDYRAILPELLLTVEKPARYTGGEFNTPDMAKPCKARLALCFPDIYEIAMSNLGISILYQTLNDNKDFVAERCFAPWPDYAKVLKDNGIPLLSIETATPLKEFDAVGFSIQYELLYSNILYMLDLAGIPFYAKDRGEDYPILIAGGPCTVNPLPFADFFDVVGIGEGEEMLPRLMEVIAEGREKGLSKKEILMRAKAIEGVYVPALFKEGERVKKAWVADFENAFYPVKPLVPNIEIVHDRAVLELYRGCASGCRFCQAGFYYRPIRERSPQKLIELAEQAVVGGGFDELSLASLSTGDYSCLKPLMDGLKEVVKKKRVNLSLPSLRLSSFEGEFSESSRKSSLTFAPEAGTQRLRDVINKNITDEDIFGSIEQAFIQGYDTVKLYFMLGLPTETDDDLAGIIDLVKRIRELYIKTTGRKRITVSVSCSVFIPKPVTPFQWAGQISLPEMLRRQNLLRQGLRAIKGVNFSWHGAESSVLEAALARGDGALSEVLIKAFESGAKFDGWTESFNWEIWERAFNQAGIKIADYTAEFDISAPLPWDFIDTGVTKKYLIKEYKKAHSATVTSSCREVCNACGAAVNGKCVFAGGGK